MKIEHRRSRSLLLLTRTNSESRRGLRPRRLALEALEDRRLLNVRGAEAGELPRDTHRGDGRDTQTFLFDAADCTLTGRKAFFADSSEESQRNTALTTTHTKVATFDYHEYPAIYPNVLALADMDGDGDTDIAYCGDGFNVNVRWNNGSGTFDERTTVGADWGPTSIEACDLNHDEIIDLVVGQGGGSYLSVLIGTGGGGFEQTYTDFYGIRMPSVAVANINDAHDNHPDIVAVDSVFGRVQVLLGTGNGTFDLGETISASSTDSVALGDCDGDGHIDLVTTKPTSRNNVSIRYGIGDGTFVTGTTCTVPADPYSVDLARLDADGDVDVVTANHAYNNSCISVLRDGCARTDYILDGANPSQTALGDVDGDGDADIVTANNRDNSVSILFNRGDGTFDVGETIPVGRQPADVALADLNADGYLDIVSANNRGYSGTLSVLLQRRGPQFPALSAFDTNLEGWTLQGDGAISWQPQGGNLGGCLQIQQPASDLDDYSRAVAPPQFLGDWSALAPYGVLSFDLRYEDYFNIGFCEVRISGPGGTAIKRISGGGMMDATRWEKWIWPLHERYWEVTEGVWDSLLENVESLTIGTWFYESEGTVALDNVFLGADRPAVYPIWIEDYSPGPDVPPDCSQASAAGGPPDGESCCLGEAGSLTLFFYGGYAMIVDETGPDLTVFEVEEDAGQMENYEVLVSQDNQMYFSLGQGTGGEEQFDLIAAGLSWAKYVRICDLSLPEEPPLVQGWGEIDALAALHWRYSDEMPPFVADRHVFYNESDFDGQDATASQQDDHAIADDKTPLLPGQTATFANYTSYSRGINGVMVDIANLPGTPTAADFAFRVGNDDDPDTWDAVAVEPSIDVRVGQGVGGSDRVTIIFDDHAIQNQWLQVTVLASANTGLTEDDVFYFGNAVGESGNAAGDARVNAVDILLARNNPRTLVDPAPIDFPYDFNRDQRVNATDMSIARNHQTHRLDALRLITGPKKNDEARMTNDEAPGSSLWHELEQADRLDFLHALDAVHTQSSKKDAPDQEVPGEFWDTCWSA